MTNLPHEIILDILSRLPIKSLLRFRCVCKPWRSLVRDPDFVNTHLNRAIGNDNLSLVLKSGPNLFDLCSPIDYESSNQPVKLNLPFKTSTTTILKVVGSCNGLLCLSLYANCVFLFNPSTKEFKKSLYPPNEFPGHNVSRFPILGFGYSSTIQEYKVVRIVYFHRGRSNVNSYRPEVTVYTLGTDSWRRIGDIPCDIRNRSSGKLVNGALHWIASRGGNGSDISNVIISFDIGDELFREVPQPQVGDGELNMNILGVLGGCLCMICTSYAQHVEIWVMKDYGVKESWTIQFTITQPMLLGSLKYLKPLGFSKDGEILIERTDGKLVLYNPRIGSVRDLSIHGNLHWSQTVTYVASLVSLKANNEVEDQRQR